jgi:hypothetical protein
MLDVDLADDVFGVSRLALQRGGDVSRGSERKEGGRTYCLPQEEMARMSSPGERSDGGRRPDDVHLRNGMRVALVLCFRERLVEENDLPEPVEAKTVRTVREKGGRIGETRARLECS